LDAGLVYNSWPKFAESWVPENMLTRAPMWRNFFENDAYLTLMTITATWLLYYVPVWLASLHQCGSMTLLSFALWLTNELRRVPK
uniref:Inositol phosphorylceramide synthase n=1 Tax=Heligmosomoides polygyrus TaxID=6339 RepID=A0A183FXQ8_HELPZ